MASNQLQDSSDEESPRIKAFYRWCCCYRDHQKTSKKARKNRDKQDKPTCSETAEKHTEEQEILRLQKFLETHKTNMMKKVERIFEGKKQNEALLKDVYTELFITEGDMKDANQEHEILKMDDAFKNKKTQDKPIKCNDIFTLLRENNEEKIVLTKGVTGIGKTVSVHKFILDWAEGKANQDIDCVFLLPFRDINSIKDREFNLHEFLLKFYPELKDLEKSELYKECKLAFIFDGLDESRLPLNFESGTLNNVEERSSVDELFTSLVTGKLLPSALVWVTSRPAAANQIPPQYVGLFTEVRGFTDQQKEEYFRKRITDETQASRIISHIKKSRSLYIMCHIPVFCWITATVLQNILKNNTENISTTLTEMYIHFLLIQMNMKSPKYGEQEERERKKLLDSNRVMIRKLAKLAFEQLKKENIVFHEEDLKACGIDVSEETEFTGMIAEIFKKEDGLHEEKVFSFVHLSVQEFLAAVHVFLCYLNKNMQELQFFFDEPIENIRLHELLEKAVDKAMKSKRGHLDLFLQFLVGISLGSSQNLLKGLIEQTEDTTESIQKTTKYIKQIQKNISDEASVNLFYCLFELKDHSLYEEIQRYLSSDEHPGRELSSSVCTVLTYILLMSEKVLDEFNPKRFTSPSNYKRLAPALRCCRKALLHSQFSALWSEEQENSEAFIMATADQMLKLFFCWIKEKEHFADNLRKLAEELESLRKKCNVGECVGTTVTVLGGIGMIGAGVATMFTFGAAAPLFNVASTCTNVGSTISACTKIIEDFLSCSIMKKVQDIEKSSNEITKEIQQLFQILTSEQEEVNPSAEPDELEHQIMAEFLRAIARQSGVNVQIINDSVISDMLNHTPQKFPLEKISDIHSRGARGGSSSSWAGQRSERRFERQSGLNVQIINDSMINHTPQKFPLEKIRDMHNRGAGGDSSSAWVGRRSEGLSGDWMDTSDTSNPQINETCLENHKIMVNSLVVSGAVILSGVLMIIQHNRKRITKLSDTVFKTLSSAGFQTTLIGGVMVVKGLGVITRALPEMIDNWKEMISGNHVTEASQSLRDTADGIQNTTQKMKEQIEKIKKILQEIEQEQQKTKEIEQEQQKTKEIEQEQLELQKIEQELFNLLLKQEQQKRKTEVWFKQKEQEESSEEESEDPPAVNVGLLNVHSILNMKGKRIEIKNLIIEHNLDVFLITETWLKDNTADEALREASPPNFQFHYKCRITDTLGGGVAIQFSKKLQSERIPFDSITITTFEYVATALKHDKWDEDVLFINVYHPPIKTVKNQPPTKKEQFEKFVNEIKKLLNEASAGYNHIIVAGDFNVPVKKTSKKQMKSFKEAFKTFDFKQHVEKPTHNGDDILDLVFSRNVEVSIVKINRDKYKDLNNYNSDHDNNSKKDSYISDHSTVYFSIRPLPKSKDAKTKANPLKKGRIVM